MGQGTGTLQTALLLGWLLAETFNDAAITRDANGAVTSMTFTWPDGIAGVFTADTLSVAFPGAIDAWHATYAGPPAKTFTQPLVTREPINGAVIVRPAITIA